MIAASTPPPPPPVEIFTRAEQVWHAQQLPPFVEFTANVQSMSDPVRIVVRTADGAVSAKSIPAQPQALPRVFPGARLSGPDGVPLGFCVSTVSCVGVLGADPFGGRIPAQPANLKTIASVASFANPYEVTLRGIKDFQDRRVYDLTVYPRDGDPRQYPLREMLVDTEDFHTWELLYNIPDYRRGDLKVAYFFGPVGGIWYLLVVCEAAPMSPRPGAELACTPDTDMLWNFTFPRDVPDWYFDRTLYERHAQTR